jgi:hypothetical protein
LVCRAGHVSEVRFGVLSSHSDSWKNDLVTGAKRPVAVFDVIKKNRRKAGFSIVALKLLRDLTPLLQD